MFIGVHAKYPILDCVRAEVTLGEIADTLRAVYGEYEDSGLE